jgi:hypothetical protein
MHSEEQLEEDGLGIENGSFKWNEVEDTKIQDPRAAKIVSSGVDDGQAEDVLDTQSTHSAGSERRFELKDINVMFPEGELSLITGPTASGKTALLVRVCSRDFYFDLLMKTLTDGTPRRDDCPPEFPHYHVEKSFSH